MKFTVSDHIAHRYYGLYCKCQEFLPDHPLKSHASMIGWLFILLSGLVWFLGMSTTSATINEFISSDVIPVWMFSLINLWAGYTVAVRGERNRLLRNFAGVVACMFWIGACVWPVFTGSGNPVLVLGIIFFLHISLQLLLFADSNDQMIVNSAPEQRNCS